VLIKATFGKFCLAAAVVIEETAAALSLSNNFVIDFIFPKCMPVLYPLFNLMTMYSSLADS
jgi:hypothetical protein